MVEEVIHDESSKKTKAVRGLTGRSVPRPIGDVSANAEDRIHLAIGEFARVLGGGIVPGSIILVGGDPGIGKSTLMLQMAMEMASQKRVLYVSGEESERQIKMRAVRLNGKKELPKNLLLVTETNLEVILNHINETKPELLIIDSIQTVYLSELDSSAGSVSQVRECSSQLRELAKTSGISVFVIGHVTKEGSIAGPRVLEHIVDTGPLPRRRPLPGVSFASFGQEPFRRDLRSGGIRNARRRTRRSDKSIRSVSGRTDDQRGRFLHRSDHGRHASHPG